MRSAAANPECNDGVDNDGDGLVDVLEDPGCRSAGEDSVEGPACHDGIDDDGDGLVDFPEDTHCKSPLGTREKAPACGLGGELVLAPLAWFARRRRRLGA